MSEIPKIARARLEQQAAGAGNHPDADQMTAFLERSLGAREREQVLEHLARCAQCREVVAVALPPEEETARAAQPAPEFRWFEWQTLRWAAVAATFVIAASLIFQTYQRAPERSSRETAENQPVAATAPAESAKQAEAGHADESQAPAPGGAVAAKEKAPSTSTVAVARDQETEVARGPSKLDSVNRAKTGQKSGELAVGGGVGGGISGGRMDDLKKLGSEGKAEAGGTLMSKAATAPAPPMVAQRKAGPAAQQQQVAGLAQQAPSAPAAREELHRQAAAEPASRAAADQAEAAKVTGQNEIVAVEKDADKRARNAAAPAGGFAESWKMSAAAAPMRWVITAQGLVQRSMDNGSTWKSVRLDSRIRFRAVAASGSEVWAGGEGGALYHSSDSGDHWTRVALPTELASATIVRVEFTDSEHGTLSTSAGETWTTRDGGSSWKKP